MFAQSLPSSSAHGLSSAVTCWPAAFAARSCSIDADALRVEQVEGRAGCLLETEQHGDRRVPDQAVVRGVRAGVGEGVPLAAVPEAGLDVVHQPLVVGMDHQRQPGGPDRLEDLEQLAVVVDADARHVRVDRGPCRRP